MPCSRFCAAAHLPGRRRTSDRSPWCPPGHDNSESTELGGDGYACQSITSRAPATDAGNFRNVANAGSIEFDPAALVVVLLQKLISCFTASAMYFF
jgi:hypothetical protein